MIGENLKLNNIVFRIQDVEGRGPWKPGFSHKWVQDREDHENLLPWHIEFGRVTQYAYSWELIGCGCTSIEQLRRWFTDVEYCTLLSYGYQAVQITASRILAQSDTQCVFTTKIPFNKQFVIFDLYPKGVLCA